MAAAAGSPGGIGASPPGSSPSSLRRKVFRKTRKSPAAAERSASEDSDEEEVAETAAALHSPKRDKNKEEDAAMAAAAHESESGGVRRPLRLSTVAMLVMALRTKDRRQRESRRDSIVESRRNSSASADQALGLAEGLTQGLNAMVSEGCGVGGDEDAGRIKMRGPQKDEKADDDGNLGDGAREIPPLRPRGPTDAAVTAAAKGKKFSSSAFKKGPETSSAVSAVRRPREDGGRTQLNGGGGRRRLPPPRADGGAGDAKVFSDLPKKGAKKTSQNGTAVADGREAPTQGRKKRLSNLDLSAEKTTTTTSRSEAGSSEWHRRRTTKSKYGLGKQQSILPDGSERQRAKAQATTGKRPSQVEGRKGGGGEGVLNHRQKEDKKGKVGEEEFGGRGRGGPRRDDGRGRPPISARLDLSDEDSGCADCQLHN